MKVVRITDIGKLVQARFDYFDNDPLVPPADRDMLAANLRRYFEEHIPAGDFVAFAVAEGEAVAAVGFMSVTEMPPSGSVPNGRMGTLFNILTYPEYRGRGYGKALLQAIIGEAKELGLSVIDLHATEQGVGLYEKLGFEYVPYSAMRLKLFK